MANTLKYTDAAGPAFVDGTTGFTWTLNLQGLSADRIVTAPNAAGTLAFTASPTFTGVPAAPTAADGTNTTQIATTAFVHKYAPLISPTFTAEINVTGKVLTTAGLGVGNSAAATTPGTVTKKIEVFDAAGVSLGFLAVYDAIT